MRDKTYLLILFFCFTKALSQTNEMVVTVFDSLYNPIEEVLFIEITSEKELKTDYKGEVVIRGEEKSSYILFKENYITKQYSWLELNENRTVILENDNQILSELLIYVSPTKNDASSINYKINEKYLGENPTVFNVIENIPMFFIKGEKINYKGKGVTIIINGKKTIGKIENIDPKNIESIEVIPYGHSAYGVIGEPVVNIVMKDNVLDYFREDLNVGYNLNKGNYVFNANSFFKKNKVTVSLPIRLGKSVFDSHSTIYSASKKINNSIDKTKSYGLTLQPEISIKINDKNSISSSFFLYTPKNKNDSKYNTIQNELEENYKQDINYLNTGALLSYNNIVNDSTSFDISFLYTYNEYKNKGDYQEKSWGNILYDNALNFDVILKKRKRQFFKLPMRYDIYYSYYYSELKNVEGNNVNNERHKFAFNTTLSLIKNVSFNTDLSYNLINNNKNVLLNSSTLAFNKNSFSAYLNYYNSYQLISAYDLNKQNSIDSNLNTNIDNYNIKKSNIDNLSIEFNYSIKNGVDVFIRGKYKIHHNAPVSYLFKSDEDMLFKTNLNLGKNLSYAFDIGGFFEINDRFIIQSLLTFNKSQAQILDYKSSKNLVGYDFYAKYNLDKGLSFKFSSSYNNYNMFSALESNKVNYPFVSLTIEKEFINKNLKTSLVINNPFIKAKEQYNAFYSDSFDNINIVDTRFKSKEIKNYSSIYVSLSYTLGNKKLRMKRDLPIKAKY
ncbi:outer membrane beta-barrel protein [Myroides odoratimimus]|uniref:outer membrane beta-barrel protein n=1 Tax=Myroides odoratimimus TaxID=76832 RepID=UPI0025773D72|nr:outer membrane beta-barrel protein [Myroides odoratimimus]MDM1398931.1 outer membrane beta-barrel protein [Myroides odoratimimus]MEC4054541.1 outer membrane beta-barrel protein [Myroides odoratimimus]